MGTYYDYKLHLFTLDDDMRRLRDAEKDYKKEVVSALRSKIEEAYGALNEEGNSWQSAKWYDFKEDMISFSLDYSSQVIFIFRVSHPQDKEDVAYWGFQEGETDSPILMDCTIYAEMADMDDIEDEEMEGG